MSKIRVDPSCSNIFSPLLSTYNNKVWVFRRLYLPWNIFFIKAQLSANCAGLFILLLVLEKTLLEEKYILLAVGSFFCSFPAEFANKLMKFLVKPLSPIQFHNSLCSLPTKIETNRLGPKISNHSRKKKCLCFSHQSRFIFCSLKIAVQSMQSFS